MTYPITKNFELAVRLHTTRQSNAVKAWIDSSGGLKHPTLPLAYKAARRIAQHGEVYYVNVSEVTVQSKGIVR